MALRTIQTLSICSGIGGLDIGFSIGRGDVRTVCYVEREAFSVACLVKAFSEGVLDEAPIWSDLQTFDCGPWRGRVDCIIGGIPCQPFSVAGKQREADDERNLWPRTAEIIAELEPGLIFIENVEGILGYYYHTIFPALQAMGYTVEAGLFSSEEVGATQVRRRLFILAIRDVVCASSGGTIGSGGMESRVEGVCAEREEKDTTSGKSSSELEHADGEGRQRRRGFDEHSDQQSVAAASGTLASNDGGKSGLYGQQPRRPETRRAGTPTLDELRGAEPEHDEAQEREYQGGGTGEDVRAARLFVPGPEDYEQWSSLLSEMPTLKPAFCGEPDGDADDLYHAARQYRLWALGNGVVPLVAAHAYRTLATRIEVRQ